MKEIYGVKSVTSFDDGWRLLTANHKAKDKSAYWQSSMLGPIRRNGM
jgi:hypothetical protein